MTLFSMPINSESPISDKEIRILKVKCPSTGAYYCLRVPPQVNTCEEARQWTFGKELNEIRGDKDAPKLESYMNFEKET